MEITKRLVLLADTYCAAVGLSRARVSTLVLGNGRRLDDIETGRSDVRTRKYEHALAWFWERWPADVDWPAGVERPGPGQGIASPEPSAPHTEALGEAAGEASA